MPSSVISWCCPLSLHDALPFCVVLGGDACIAGTGSEYLAARDARDLFRLFLVVRERCTGFLWLPVREILCSAHERQETGETNHERSEEHTSELQSLTNLVCRLL